MSNAILEARAVILGEDRTAGAFASVEARIKELGAQTRRVGEASASINKVAHAVDAVSRSVGTSDAALRHFVESARTVDAVAASVARAQKGMPQAAALLGSTSKAIGEVTAAEKAFGAETERLGKAGQKLQIFKALQSGFAETRATFNEASAEVQRLGRELAAAEAPTKKMQRDYAEAQRSVSLAASALDAQKSAMMSAKREFESLAGPISTVASAEARLAREAEVAARALAHQGFAARHSADEIAAQLGREKALHEVREHRRQAWHQVSDELLPFAGPGILEVTKKTAEAGAEVQHERVGLMNAGRTPAEIEEIEKASRETSAKLPTATYEENLKVIAETTSAFGSLHHAIENLPFMQQTMSILHTAAGDKIEGGPGEVGRQLAKFFEDRMTKPEDFQKEASLMIPPMVATGGVFNPREMYMFAQQAKSSLPNYDLDFLSTYMPALVARSNGEKAGTAANAFTNTIMGKARDAKQAGAWLHLGLLDPTKLTPGSKGPVGWQAGAVKGTDLALANPVRWAEEVLIPAMQKQGIDTTNRMEVAKVLATMFRNQMANYMANEIAQDQSLKLLHKDKNLFGQVGNSDDIYNRNLAEDPTASLKALGSSLETFASTLTSPVMKDAASIMASISGGIGALSKSLGDFDAQHPDIAKVLAGGALGAGLGVGGYLTTKLFTNIGSLLSGGTSAVALTASATALDGSAAALTSAAAALSLGGKVPGAGAASGAAETAAGGGFVAWLRSLIPASTGEATAAGGFLGGVAGLAALIKASVRAQQPGQGGAWSPPTPETRPLDEARLEDKRAEIADLQGKIDAARARAHDPSAFDPVRQQLEDQKADLQNQVALLKPALDRMRGTEPLPHPVSHRIYPDVAEAPPRRLPPMTMPVEPTALDRLWRILDEINPIHVAPARGATLDEVNPIRVAPARGATLDEVNPIHVAPARGATLDEINPRSDETNPIRVSPAISLPHPIEALPSRQSRDVVPVHVVDMSLPTRAFPAGLHPDFTLGSHGFGPGYGADDHFGPWPRHQAPPIDVDHSVHPSESSSGAEAIREALSSLLMPLKDMKVALDPASKATITADIKVGPSSELLTIVSQAKQISASGSLASGGTTGGLGTARTSASPGVGKSR